MLAEGKDVKIVKTQVMAQAFKVEQRCEKLDGKNYNE